MKALSDRDEEVVTAVDEAVGAALERLDELFPGGDKAGITSNFQGLLSDVVMQMLTNRLDTKSVAGHCVKLRRLVLDDAFFGRLPVGSGDAFLIRIGNPEVFGVRLDEGVCQLQVLSPDSRRIKSISKAQDAWSNEAAAVQAAIQFLKDEGVDIPTAESAQMTLIPVRPDDRWGWVVAR